MKYTLLALFTFLFALPVSAQTESGGTPLFVSVSPQYPKAGETVRLTLQSSVIDLANETVTWRAGNEALLSGIGETIAQITAPKAGAETRVTVGISSRDEQVTVLIVPASVDLMWEADTYAPGLYRGRHLGSAGATIRLVALPHLFQNGVELTPSQLTYTWKRNGTVLGSLSGRGKSTLSIQTALLGVTDSVSVTVVSADKALGAEAATTILSSNTSAQLYFDHPLYGVMYHTALSTQTAITDTEMGFVAVPFFAPGSDANDKLFSYLWRVNGSAVEANDERPNTLVINAGSSGGSAEVELSVTHKQNFRLDAHGSWNISFGSVLGGGSSDLFTGQ